MQVSKTLTAGCRVRVKESFIEHVFFDGDSYGDSYGDDNEGEPYPRSVSLT